MRGDTWHERPPEADLIIGCDYGDRTGRAQGQEAAPPSAPSPDPSQVKVRGSQLQFRELRKSSAVDRVSDTVFLKEVSSSWEHAFTYAVVCLKHFWGSVIRRVGNLTEGKSRVERDLRHCLLRTHSQRCLWHSICGHTSHPTPVCSWANTVATYISNFHSATFRNSHIAKRRSVKDEYCSPRRDNLKAMTLVSNSFLFFVSACFLDVSGLVAKQSVPTL
jgi:hypothetical protein